MLWTEQLFHIKKPIIAMLHPDALTDRVQLFLHASTDRIHIQTEAETVEIPLVHLAAHSLEHFQPALACRDRTRQQ